MASNKLITAKEVILKDLECEMEAIDKIKESVNSQLNRLEIEGMDLEDRKRKKDLELASRSAPNNQTTPDPTLLHQVSSETIIKVDVESHVNQMDLDLSMTAALGFRNNPNYEESSDYEDSM